MSRHILVLAWMTLGLVNSAWAQDPTASKAVALPKAQLNKLNEEVRPAWQSGNPRALLQSLEPLVVPLRDAHRAAVDHWLAENNLPPLTEMLVDARLALIEQQAAQVKAPAVTELVLLLQGLKDRLDKVLAERETHVAFRDGSGRPATFVEYERRFWDMHVLDNRLATARRWAQYAQQENSRSHRLNLRRLTEQQREVLAIDFALLDREVAGLAQELAERTLELRLARLTWAEGILVGVSSTQDRFQAAFAVDLDGEQLVAFFDRLQQAGAVAGVKPREGPVDSDGVGAIFFRKALLDAELPDKVRRQIERARLSAGDELLTKSRMLFTGMHWWLRGRYGMGTDGGGFLKSEAALSSPQAQFALYMPVQTPRVSDAHGGQSAGQSAGPQVDRRHHYLWQFETRNIQASRNTSRKTVKGTPQISGIIHLSHFY